MANLQALEEHSSKYIGKYFRHYCEAEVALAAALTPNRFRHAAVVPCFNESIDNVERLLEQVTRGPNLLVVVVNEPDNADPHARQANRVLIHWLQSLSDVSDSKQTNQHLLYFPWRNGGCLVVERCGDHSLPAKRGVGLARKIGADIAAAWHLLGHVESPWIGSTDADACLPPAYFDAVPATDGSDTSAVVFPFKHVPNGDNNLYKATLFYECLLHYYVLGIRFSQAPYDHHSIGSVLCINAHAYLKARGFPRRSGGEDFYLLNKLAKLGRIHKPSAPVIELRARSSQRVPFGTGPAVARIATLTSPETQIDYYHPYCFFALKRSLQRLQQHSADTDLPHNSIVEASDALLRTWQLPDTTSGKLFTRVDAFQILKMIHWLRDHHFGNLTWASLLNHSGFAAITGFSAPASDPEILIHSLRQSCFNHYD